jgi:pyrimidine deaminase RibD-like protein
LNDVDYVKSFLAHVGKFSKVYTSIYIAVLAVRKRERWVLLKSIIILTPGNKIEPPGGPCPSEFILLLEERDIGELEGIIEKVQKDGIVEIDGKTIYMELQSEAENRWTWFELDDKRNQWYNNGSLSVGIRVGDNTLSSVLRGLDFDFYSSLRRYYKRQYKTLEDFSRGTIGVEMDSTSVANVDIIAPTWTIIEEASLEKGIVTLEWQCPAFYLSNPKYDQKLELHLTLEVEGILKYPDSWMVLPQGNNPIFENVDDNGVILRCKDRFQMDDDLDSPLRDIDATYEHRFTSKLSLADRQQTLLDTALLILRGVDENPNKVNYNHFLKAVDLSRKCKPDKPGTYPHVGCVIINDGEIIAHAYRGEIGKGDHAEFIALERKAKGDARVAGADLLTTLEPCTVRSHDKRPCVSWIKARNIRKVWIGTLDPNPVIAGQGELQLQKDEILIGRFPDSLTKQINEINDDFFKDVAEKQPQLSQDEQISEKRFMVDTLREQLKLSRERMNSLYEARIQLMGISDREIPIGNLNEEIDATEDYFVDAERESGLLQRALNHALIIDADDASGWVRLGNILSEGEKFGLAGQSYLVATKVNATIDEPWYGLAKCETTLNKDWVPWPVLRKSDFADTTPGKAKSEAWEKLTLEETNSDLQLRILCRALKSGAKSERIRGLLIKRFREDSNTKEEHGENIEVFWVALQLDWEHLGDREMSALCYSKSVLLMRDDIPDCLPNMLYPWRIVFALNKWLSEEYEEFPQEIKDQLVEQIAFGIKSCSSINALSEISWYVENCDALNSENAISQAINQKEVELEIAGKE